VTVRSDVVVLAGDDRNVRHAEVGAARELVGNLAGDSRISIVLTLDTT
jgi:hypothetical protein